MDFAGGLSPPDSLLGGPFKNAATQLYAESNRANKNRQMNPTPIDMRTTAVYHAHNRFEADR